MTMHPKEKKRNALISSNSCPKRALLKLKKISLIILCLLLSSSFLSQKKFHQKFMWTTFCHGPMPFFLQEHHSCLSHRKTRWPMQVNNIGLLETANSMVTLTFLSLVWTEVVRGQVQQPITCFTRPWDNFMVHGVNNPLVFPSHRNQRMPSKYLVLKLPSCDNLTSQKMVSWKAWRTTVYHESYKSRIGGSCRHSLLLDFITFIIIYLSIYSDYFNSGT